MLRIEAYGPGGTSPAQIEASRVLIRDRHGNPLCVAIVYDGDQLLVAHVNDPDFDLLLATFGVESAVVLNRIDVPAK